MLKVRSEELISQISKKRHRRLVMMSPMRQISLITSRTRAGKIGRVVQNFLEKVRRPKRLLKCKQCVWDHSQVLTVLTAKQRWQRISNVSGHCEKSGGLGNINLMALFMIHLIKNEVLTELGEIRIGQPDERNSDFLTATLRQSIHCHQPSSCTS